MPTFNSDDENLTEEETEDTTEETSSAPAAPAPVAPAPVVDNSSAERLRRRHLGYI